MGSGWYRGAYYPPEARIDRRSVDDLAEELVREATDGVGESGVDPGDHRRDRHRQAVGLRGRGTRPSCRRARGQAHRPVDHHPFGHVPGRPGPAPHLRGGGPRPRRVVIGHSDSYPVLDHYLEIIRRGASIEFDFLGMTFTAVEQHGEDRLVEILGELLSRGHADRILLSQDVCNDAQLARYGGHGYVYLAEKFLPRLRYAGITSADIETMTVANPRRMLTIED